MLIGGANNPPFDGMLIPSFPSAEILMKECLHSDGHKSEGRIVMVSM